MKSEFIKCPICKGKGDLPAANAGRMATKELKRQAAKVLRQNGYGQDQIKEVLGLQARTLHYIFKEAGV